MVKIADLTKNELEVLTAVYANAGNEYEIEDRKGVEYYTGDNYTWFSPSDIIRSLKDTKSRESVAATLGQLQSKGLIALEMENCSQYNSYINESCHEAVLEWIDSKN